MTEIQKEQEKRINNILEEGERVIWTGTSDPYPLLLNDAKKYLFMRWILCASIIAALFILVFSLSKGMNSGVLIIAILTAFLVYEMFLPLLDRKKITQKNTYFLTNRRALMLDSDANTYSINLL